jgi:hypothetical protein
MSIQEVSAEQFAELLHHYTQALAPDFSYPLGDSRRSWNDVSIEEPGQNDYCSAFASLGTGITRQ